MGHTRTLVISTLILIVGQSLAQKQTTPTGTPPVKPAAENERAKLKFLVGSFATQTSIPPIPSMPKGATGKGNSLITWALDSMFVLIDEQSENTLFGRYRGHGVLGFNAQTRQFELSMFNNSGDHISYKGTFVGDTLVMETRVAMPGRPFDQRLLWYKDRDVVRLIVLNDIGKGYTTALEQTYTPAAEMTK
jgi:hypothetical protein